MKRQYIASFLAISFFILLAGCVSLEPYKSPANQSAGCTDSDGGLNAQVAGSVSAGGALAYDRCADSGTLTEYLCLGAIVQNVTVACGPGYMCAAGACISTAAPQQNGTPGTANGTQGTGPGTQNQSAGLPNPASEYCTSMNYTWTLRSDAAGQAGYCHYAGLECDEWKLYRRECCLQKADCGATNCSGSFNVASCTGQACTCPAANATQGQNGTANASAGQSGNATGNATYSQPCTGTGMPDYNKKESVQYRGALHADYCITADVVKDYYCDAKGGLQSANYQCDPGYGCTDGACAKYTYSCTDNDGGNNTGERGHVIVVKGYTKILDEWDDCLDEGAVKEWVCEANGSASIARTECGNAKKCVEGRCVLSLCTDTDGGYNLTARGTVTKRVLGGEDLRETDYCPTGDSVREYYCYGDTYLSSIARCPSGMKCADGRCG